MSYQTQRVITHSHDNDRTAPTGDSDAPAVSNNPEQYIHPFLLVPEVTQPQFDTRFKSLPEQRAQRIDALFNLSALTIMEDGATPTTDRWLEIVRQDIRTMSDTLAEFDRERLSMMGLVATYLASDPTLRPREDTRDTEAGIYKTRVVRAEDLADNSYNSGSPYRMAHLAIKHTLDNLHGDQRQIAMQATDTLPTDPSSPEFTHAKANALFDYATTMPPTNEKRGLLLEAMKYADETCARAKSDDYMLRASALHTLARSIHDASYIPYAFSKNDKANTELAKQARNFSVALLQQSTLEFQTAHSKGINTPTDSKKQWNAQTELDKAYDDARYFVDIYGETVRAERIYMPKTPEIERLIAAATALKFGHNAVSHAQDNATVTQISTTEPAHAMAA